jgi:dolichyldiphosphatase
MVVKSIGITHVQYESKDILAKILAYSSLIPIFTIQSLVTLIYFQRDIRILILLLGQLINELINKILKTIIKHPRPHGLHFGIF